MFDIRYHIASLVAVFLSLAIGIILGTVIVDKGVLVEQQKVLVRKLENEFSKLREENSRLRSNLKKEKEFNNIIIPLALKERLANKTVVFIQTTELTSEVKEKVVAAVKMAGASVSYIKINYPWQLTDATKKVLAQYFDTTQDIAEDHIFSKLAKEFKNPSDSRFIEDLSSLGFLGIDTPLVKSADVVVFIGGLDSRKENKNFAQQLDVPFINNLKAIGLRVIGVETTQRELSYIPYYQRIGIPTVDNIDQKSGRVSLVYVLSGYNGSYGVGSNTQGLLPKL
jgi:hypothetical protein